MTDQNIRAIKRQRRKKILQLIAKCYYLNKRRQKTEVYNLIADEMLSLGGIYIKFLQGVMLQSWMLKRWDNPEKMKIFEKMDTESIDVEQILRYNLKDNFQRLASFDKTPFAAGSFGQVYKGRLDNGQKVIIKVLRPLIKETLDFDLKLISRFWKLTYRALSTASHLNADSVLKEFTNQTLRETDYVSEAHFAHEQYQVYKDHPQLVIPQTYLELCNDQIIIQDYIGGISAAELLNLHNQGTDAVAYIKDKLGSDLLQQLHVLSFEIFWGTFHLARTMGDAHPGNIKFLKNNKVALIDFGISARACQNQTSYLALVHDYHNICQGQIDLVSIFSNSLRFFAPDLYRALHKMGSLIDKDLDMNQELARIVEENFKALTGEDDLTELLQSPRVISLFDRLINNNNKFGFRIKIQDAEMLRAIIAPSYFIDALGLFKPVMSITYPKLIKQVNKVYPELQTQAEPTVSNSAAIDIIFGWLERVANADPALFNHIVKKLQLSQALIARSSNNQPLTVRPKRSKLKHIQGAYKMSKSKKIIIVVVLLVVVAAAAVTTLLLLDSKTEITYTNRDGEVKTATIDQVDYTAFILRSSRQPATWIVLESVTATIIPSPGSTRSLNCRPTLVWVVTRMGFG